jgi:hypothetical protein
MLPQRTQVATGDASAFKQEDPADGPGLLLRRYFRPLPRLELKDTPSA